MEKQKLDSVTNTPCSCGYLQRSADNPDLPIFFNSERGDFRIRCIAPGAEDGRRSMVEMMIYHCPWCGGVAPSSKPDPHFAAIPEKEQQRLRTLMQGLNSLDQAIEKFGRPDQDNPRGVTQQLPSVNGQPPVIQSFRSIVFTRLSDSADVHVTDYLEKGIGHSFRGKYIKKPPQSESAEPDVSH